MTLKRKILVIDDDTSFLNRIKTNIKKFDVITTPTISGAIKSINKDGISFIVADIKLSRGKHGYTIFSKLFSKGNAIPGILITGNQLTPTKKDELKLMGALDILQKGGGTGPLSKRIEESALKILEDRKNNFEAISRQIKYHKLENKPIYYEGETTTIEKLFDHVIKSQFPIEEEGKIIKKICSVCNTHLRHTDSLDYAFPKI